MILKWLYHEIYELLIGVSHRFAHGEDVTGLNSKATVNYVLRMSTHQDSEIIQSPIYKLPRHG